MNIYIFFREDFFYPLELGSDEEAIANALCNPGTTKVETWKGEPVWRPKQAVVMPDRIKAHNANNEPCDMLVGPCCCGAWHQDEDAFRLLSKKPDSAVANNATAEPPQNR